VGCLSSSEENSSFHRRLNIGYHLSQSFERDVDVWYDKSKTSLMSSPCRPEDDGYFGSTSGTPMEFQFGFELETEDDENVEYLLDAVQEQLVDVILSSTFPNLCGYRRREERTRLLSAMRGLSTYDSKLKSAKPRITGFHFGEDIQERTGTYSVLNWLQLLLFVIRKTILCLTHQ
jgi:hypothetical protein